MADRDHIDVVVLDMEMELSTLFAVTWDIITTTVYSLYKFGVQHLCTP